MAEAGVVQGEAKTPSDFLKSIRGKPVIVKLNSGVDYRGEASLNFDQCLF
jgi:U6 snRNA-associated Sm-like protein LSm6